MTIFSSLRKRDRLERAALFVAGLCVCIALLCVLGKSLNSAIETTAACFLILTIYLLLSRKWMIVEDTRLPVIVYHSVSENPDWLDDSSLSLSPVVFERQMRHLSRKGYRTVSLEEVLAHVEGRPLVGGKRVALTFDDGYLDNWVAVYPILKKYDFQGTVFVPTDFVDDRDAIRPTLEDVRERRAEAGDLEWRGYLSWRELLEMENSRILLAECHGKTHTRLACADKPADFYRPGDSRVWVLWNARPETKPTWFLDRPAADAEAMGAPIFPSLRSHRVRKAYMPSAELRVRLNRFVHGEGSARFFERRGWRERLMQEVKSSRLETGRWENDAEAESRIMAEFVDSRKVLEQRLGKKVSFFCWPGDEYEPWLEEIALGSGYKAATSLNAYNRSGENPAKIARIYFPFCHPGLGMDRLNVFSFVVTLRLFEGCYYYYFVFCVLSVIIKTMNSLYKRFRCP